MTVKWLDRGLVYSTHYIGLCISEKDYRRECKKLNIPPHVQGEYPKFPKSACAIELEHANGRLAMLVCLAPDDGKTLEQHYGLLTHEAVHVWQYIRNHIGEKFPSSEFEAYSIQSIAQNLFESYRKQTSNAKLQTQKSLSGKRRKAKRKGRNRR